MPHRVRGVRDQPEQGFSKREMTQELGMTTAQTGTVPSLARTQIFSIQMQQVGYGAENRLFWYSQEN